MRRTVEEHGVEAQGTYLESENQPMPNFDTTAYDAAKCLFARARSAQTNLPALMQQVDDSLALHSSLSATVGKVAVSDGQDRLIDQLARHDKLVRQLEHEINALVQATTDAERVISELADPGDALVLRLYYIMGYSERRIPKLRYRNEPIWQYSPEYVHEKKEIALIHAATVMRTIGLVGRYS